MTTRRSRGEGTLTQNKARNCWMGVADLGTDPATGRRIHVDRENGQLGDAEVWIVRAPAGAARTLRAISFD
jgi:hypothetical protein